MKTADMDANRQPNYPLIALAIGLFFIAINLVYRPIVPLDETRYVSVAWEMWANNSWLVPHINGLPYAHKPPLMFWLLSTTWILLGTSDEVTRLAVPLFSLLNLYLIRKLAQKIYPQRPQAAALAPLVLISFLGWFLYSGMIMFDLMLTVFVQAAMLSLWNYAETNKPRWPIWGGVALGLGMLTKGPVIFIYLIPFVALVKRWDPGTSVTNKGIIKASLVMTLIGIVIILGWAIPAALAGGPDYAKAIFWGQSAGRIQDSFSHARPFYWYLTLLPALIFPWLFLLGFWRSTPWRDVENGDKLCLALFAIVLGLFSCFSGKQLHYLFPVFPVLAIWIGGKLKADQFKLEPIVILFVTTITVIIFSAPLWIDRVFRNAEVTQISLGWGVLPLVLSALVIRPKALAPYRLALNIAAVLLSLSALLASISPVVHNVYDVTPVGQQIHTLQAQGQTVAYAGKYHNTFGFAGNLTEPLELAPRSAGALHNYLQNTPGYTIWIQKKPTDKLRDGAFYATPYRGRWLFIVDNKQLQRILNNE